MPTFDYQCPECQAFAADVFFKLSEKPLVVSCPVCGCDMRQVPAIGVVLGDEAAWLQSVTDIVDKDGGIHCKRFIDTPSRDNYKKWMKAEGLRPLEPGEKARGPKSDKQRRKDNSKTAHDLGRKLMEHRAINVAKPS